MEYQSSEDRHVQSVERYAILDTPPEAAFDAIACVAQDALAAPIALISFVERDRQWLKSHVGLDREDLPHGRLLHAIWTGSALGTVVRDARADARFSDDPLVTGPPSVRGVVGVPLITRDGFRVGTLCALDTRIRDDFSGMPNAVLRGLAALTIDALENRMLGHRLVYQLAERRRIQARLDLVEAVSEAVAAAPDLTSAVGGFLRLVCGHFGAPCGLIYRARPADARGADLIAEFADPEQAALVAFIDALRAAADASAVVNRTVHRALREHRPISIFDLADPRARDAGLRSGLFLPFHEADRWFAVVLLFRDAPRRLDDIGATVRRLSTRVLPIFAIKRAETALKREQQLSRMLFENRHAPLLTFDDALRITSWNPTLEAHTGLSEAAVTGKPAATWVHEADAVRLEQAMRQALAGKAASLSGVGYAVMDTGGGVVDAHIAPLCDDDGAVIGGVCFLRDVTEQNRIEAVLRQAQKMEAIGHLAGGVAHDFNNVLTVIVGNLDLLHRRCSGDEETTHLIERAEQAATRAQTVVQQLLTVSRQQLLDPTVIDIVSVIGALRDMLAQMVGPRVPVEIRCAPDIWPVLLDRTQFEVALLNLASNAADAMPEGGTLSIDIDNVVIEPDDPAPESTPGRHVRVTVADTGAGMSGPVADSAFDPFFTTKETGKGTGLGLSQVYGFVRQSGGVVALASQPGRGTTVTLLLPVSGSAHAASPGAAPGVVAGGTERILVVEDEAAVREVAVRALRALGYVVTEAESGDIAEILLTDTPSFDLLFSDVVMPGRLQGTDLARIALERAPALKVLLTSGRADRLQRGTQIPAGARFLPKPYGLAELARAVTDALDRPTPDPAPGSKPA